MGKQVSQYDKIFKENIEAVIPSIIKNILGITAFSSEELPDDIQHTKERKPDVLKKITDSQGNVYVLQIEFQVADEPKMIYRMAEYYVMLERKYEIPIEQYVIYLGAAKPVMPTQLVRKRMTFEYPLISFSELDYHIFLQSDRPEEIVLGVLGDFKGDTPEIAIGHIIQRIEETVIGDFPLMKYFRQLRVLAQLRNLGDHLKDIAMDSIAKFVSVEKDAAYMVGFDKGEEQAQIRFVKNLLAKSTFTIEQIADIADVSVEFVQQMQAEK
ncbi:RpnC/YadD family protein [Spirosoma gilvum]